MRVDAAGVALQQSTRKPSAYNTFVAAHLKSARSQTQSHQEAMQMVAELYKEHKAAQTARTNDA